MNIELSLFWISVSLYALASIQFIRSLVFRIEKPIRPGIYIATAGLVIHSLTILLRWLRIGHFPFISLFELVSLGSWFCIAMFLIIAKRWKGYSLLGAVVAPLSFLMMGFASQTYLGTVPISPALKSYWLYIHIFFALLSYGCYITAAGCGILFLLKEGHPNVPDANLLDIRGYRFILFGFTNHAIMVASGAIWANQAWGRYWGWDPIETWSLITWFVYAFYLHARLVRGWRGKGCAWLSIISVLLLLLCFWGIPLFSKTIHSFGEVF